tara:strand:- start:465 stop:1010 length:546 start_codon:yes stop_codon:yes gene_type:complete
MSQVKQKRIAFDAIEYDTYQLMLKGPMDKDGFILLATFRSFDEAKLIYDWFPAIPGATIKVTNCFQSVAKDGYKKCYKTYKPISSTYERYSALDLCEQSDDLWEVIVKGRLKSELQPFPNQVITTKQHQVPIPEWTVRPIVKDDLIKIANEATKRNKYLQFIKRMADAVNPQLKILNGGKS